MSRTRGARLADHGAIGDGARGALIASDGRIDWYCPVGIDGPASLFRLVDDSRGGYVRFGPATQGAPGDQSADESGASILTTRLVDRGALLEITDHLERGRIVRMLTVLRGDVEVALDVRPGHAFAEPRKVERWSDGIAFGSLIIRGAPAHETIRMTAGERRVVTISTRTDVGVTRSGAELEALTVDGALFEQTTLRRRSRVELDSVAFDGPMRPVLLRSIRALRMLTDPSTGALVRALTTSLPAWPGNERNIDERYAWLRDNAAAVQLYDDLECRSWAGATRSWLADVAATELPLSPAYRANGDPLPSEVELGLPGWDGNGPVRTGNAVANAVDVGAMAAASLVLDADTSWPTLERLGDWLAENWARADHGPWASRGPRRRHVEGVLAVREALRALVRTAQRRNPLDPVVVQWVDAARSMDAWLATQGRFGREATTGWRRTDDDDTSDAALLWQLFGTAPELPDDVEGEADDRRVTTLEQTMAQLGEGPFVHRHLPHVDDGFPPGQAADLEASFSMVSALTMMGRWEDAHDRMEAILGALGPTGIGATHVDAVGGDLRGNLLAAPTHLACARAVLSLARGPR